jgi:hypothetical protein
MRHPLLRIDAPWRARICFVLAGTIFVLSQFVAAGPPPGRDDASSGSDSVASEIEIGDVGVAPD